MDKFKHFHHIILFVFTLGTGISVLLYPFCYHVYGYFFLTFVEGIFFGALESRSA